ncbi:MAG: hypothetical protein KL785_08315 [Brevundimonas sp.]|nr:hypothetical protein [Brevundimonas sp.]
MVMRTANIVELVMLLLGASASLLFLPDAVADYSGEPEDVWLLSFWLIFCIGLGSLCAWNALSGPSQMVSNRGALLISNWTAIILLAPVVLAGIGDTVLLIIGAVAAMGPVTQLLRLKGTATATA